jgi:hypothetical protein
MVKGEGAGVFANAGSAIRFFTLVLMPLSFEL